MATTDANIFPLQNHAFRIPVRFIDATGNLITGWTGGASVIIADAVSLGAGNAPVEVGTTGEGYLDLTATQMNGRMVQGKCTVTNSNSTAFSFAIYTYPAWDTSTGVGTANTVRPKDPLGKIAWIFANFFNLHNFSRSTGIETVYSETGGTLTSGQTIGSDIAYQHDQPVP